MTILFVGALLSCEDNPKKQMPQKNEEVVASTSKKIKYPKILEQIFDVHGGLKAWKRNKTLMFSIGEGDNKETHVIDLESRKDKVLGNQYALGYNGKEVWLMNKEGQYKGDPAFYHNLMFYFYAMPFVFADEGIQYGHADALTFEGKSYPGIKVSYDKGVGVSFKDEYFIHYDPLTFQMVWLGYSVSYRSGERSDKVNYIQYNDWVAVNKMLLPKSITWYNYEDNMLTKPRNTVVFNTVKLEEKKMPKGYYAIPQGAEIATVKEQS